jgi:hypothetical protein
VKDSFFRSLFRDDNNDEFASLSLSLKTTTRAELTRFLRGNNDNDAEFFSLNVCFSR